MNRRSLRTQLVEAMRRMRAGVAYPFPVDERGDPTVGVKNTAIQGEDAWLALHEATRLFEKLAPDLVYEIGDYITQRHLVPYVASGPDPPSDATIDKVLASLQSRPAQAWTVHRLLPRALLDQPMLTLGSFTLWRFPDEAHRVTRSSGPYRTPEDVTGSLDLANDAVFVEISVPRARYQDRAFEIAQSRFERFSNVLLFMGGGVWGSPTALAPGAVTIIATETTADGGRFEDVPSNFRWRIDPSHYSSPKLGHDRIWTMLESASLSEIEKRITTAVEWVGRALGDRDRTRSFVQTMFAFEALFNYEADRSSKFAPSLGHGMSEIAAFVLGTDARTRRTVWSRLKDLYGVRSGVAHGAGVRVGRQDHDDALRLVRELIQRLLTDGTFRGLASLADLRDWVTDRRFA